MKLAASPRLALTINAHALEPLSLAIRAAESQVS